MLYFLFNMSNSTHVYCKGCVDICPPPNDAGACAEMCGTRCMNGQMCCSFFVINRHIARQVFILNDVFLNLNNNNKQSLNMYPGTQKRIGNAKYDKTITAFHFVQYDVS
jgi:formate hydrogenlyase subunit 6/NADH:ubiquinone oxidoreductase subunit I